MAAISSGIVVGEDGIARIEGSRITVTQIACEHNGDWSPEEIQRNHTHLALGQVEAVLAYYHDHKDVRMEADDRAHRAAWEAQQADPARQAWVETIRERKRHRQERSA
ncbi:MAG: DUF433 domain-containing protein [Armatimonadetes bacterium]|nr:DUF433 domain-containing protein [Armatimonadota bacterium]